jgi:hypothetical protein
MTTRRDRILFNNPTMIKLAKCNMATYFKNVTKRVAREASALFVVQMQLRRIVLFSRCPKIK